jgi:hypothetical protein
MKSVKFFAKLQQLVSPRNEALSDHHLMHPEREWFIGLGVGCIILAGGLYWCLHIYWLYNDKTVAGESNALNQQNIYDEAIVKQALTEFSSRKERYDGLREALEERTTTSPEVVPAATPAEDVFIPLTAATSSPEIVGTSSLLLNPGEIPAETPTDADIDFAPAPL